MDDETYMPFYAVPTRQESKVWVFEDDPMPTMVKSQRAMKKVMYEKDKRISWTSIRSDLSDAGVSVSSKSIRRRLADTFSYFALPMPQGGPQHHEKIRSSPYPGKVCHPLVYMVVTCYRNNSNVRDNSPRRGSLARELSSDTGQALTSAVPSDRRKDKSCDFPRAWHHSKRRRRWVVVKDSTRNGCRDPICPSARRLRMVREDTGVSHEGATSAWMAADEAVGCTRAFLTMWRSSRRLTHVKWAQNEIAVVPDFHKRILFSDEAHFWLNGYVNKQNCRIWSEANPQVYVETPLHPEKLTVWCALWAGGILLQKR
ncbi:uncharacterized protein TNCV_4871161 [Trichonephila clavipes]|nr:uncharacterized protein TNCV_4871161 [Trichonephila clavipes]